ncbi:MAG: glycosyltransferase [Candidatus Lokiarchaeota archaeon]|nr:glycosyltransferase [Candidatus Lokiarchaeota archaeon]MBD3199203.1 glycosyltransferase [Candidatus Lokiarchaeota archaeon]
MLNILNKKWIEKKNLGKYSKQLLSFKPEIPNTYDSQKKEDVKILRILCQRPFFTGSGINVVNLTKMAKQHNIKQAVIFGHPVGDPDPINKLLKPTQTFPVIFSNPNEPKIPSELPFPVAGMSDEMPYGSTKFSSFDKEMLELYLEKFAEQIQIALKRFKPNIIHSHHLWLVTALSRVLCSKLPIVATCHNTALRQMELSPHLREFVTRPIQALDAIAVIDNTQQERVKKLYEFNNDQKTKNKFFHIGQGINTNIFHAPKKPQKREPKEPITIIYVGKLSYSKGVPQLIKAFREVANESEIPLRLNVIGSGQGPQKEEILSLGEQCDADVYFLGQIEQEALAEYFRKSDLFILPSFYDGFPKVLLEALSSGCRAIITDLPGIKSTLYKTCGPNEQVKFLPMPKMKSIDEPMPEELPEYVENLKSLIMEQIEVIKKNISNYEYAYIIRKKFGKARLFQTYLDKYKELIN